MRVRPHLTDRDLDRSQDEITRLQRSDIALLREYGTYFVALAAETAAQIQARVVVLCNVSTEEVVPAPLDWEDRDDVLGLDPAIYRTAKRALEQADFPNEVVVLLYHPQEEVVAIYTVAPDDPRDNVAAVLGDRPI